MNESYLPSLLDRLTDGDGRAAGRHHLRLFNLAETKECVARDLEALLNTRHAQDVSELAPFPLSLASILSFGIADFSHRSLANPDHRESICRSIEKAIGFHEPRLKEVAVSLSAEASSTNRLNFVIRAVLVLDQARDHVSFDALLQPTTLRYSISQARRAGNNFGH